MWPQIGYVITGRHKEVSLLHPIFSLYSWEVQKGNLKLAKTSVLKTYQNFLPHYKTNDLILTSLQMAKHSSLAELT